MQTSTPTQKEAAKPAIAQAPPPSVADVLPPSCAPEQTFQGDARTERRAVGENVGRLSAGHVEIQGKMY
jgi:hypothetical protein